MEFFKPHSDETFTKKGTVICKDSLFYLDEDKEKCTISNNRAINGDVVLVNENEVVAIEKRTREYIVGILHLNINQKFGFTKRGVPIIKFSPLSNKYPTFMVPSKSRERKALLCVITINKWKTTNKNPVGQIEHIIGPVGIIEHELQGLLYKNQMCPLGKSKQRNPKSILSNEDIQKHKWIVPKKPNEYDYETFSIDPEGCRDIDDAIHVKELDDNTYEIGIHIADVASKLDMEKIKFCFYSTVYFDGGKVDNMLNDDFTFNQASLGNGEIKGAVSLILNVTISEDSLSVKTNSFCFKSCYVKNKALSYEEADYLINTTDKLSPSKETAKEALCSLNKIAKIMNRENYTESCETFIPATKMVEHFMLLYNSLTAETLYSYSKNTILRSHKQTSGLFFEKSSPKLTEFINRLNQNAAKYVVNADNESEITHEGLGFTYYTHATSPIRRYIDILNQTNLLRYITCQPLLDTTQEQLDRVNLFNKNLRKFYNNYKKLKLVFDNQIENKDFEAYVIQIKRNTVKVFIPELDIEHNCQLISNKLECLDLVSTSEPIESDKFSDYFSWIEIAGTKISLYDCVKVNITTLPKELFFNKKLYCKIIDPAIDILE